MSIPHCTKTHVWEKIFTEYNITKNIVAFFKAYQTELLGSWLKHKGVARGNNSN